MNLEASFKNYPAAFVKNVTQVCGTEGEAWLRGLPDLVRELESDWQIEVADHFPNLTYNYVAPARDAEGNRVVLKLGLPEPEAEIFSEAEFLRHANGNGAVRLIREDRGRRALLLEHIFPGTELKNVFIDDPDGAARAAADVLERTICEPPKETEYLIDLHDWFEKLEAIDNGDFPRDIADKAWQIFADQDRATVRLIHGDLHHTNILLKGDEFVVIDPKGVIGDVRYDIGVFLNDHLWYAESNVRRTDLMNNAIAVFADKFGFSADSIARWAFAQATLSAYWTFTEHNEHWRKQLALAEFWNV